MANTIQITGTGGIIEGNLGTANVNVNLDPIYGNFNADTSSSVSNDNDFDDIWDGNGGLFSAWIYPKSMGEGNFGRIADKNQWYMNLRDESSGFVRLNFVHDFSTLNGSWKTTDRVIPLNVWSHIALFYDSDSTSNDPVLYLNGVAQTLSEDTTPAGTRSSDASSDLYFGNNSSGTRGYDGYMMDIKIYKNTAWTQPEVAVLASKINVDKDHPGLPAPGPRLYLWWKAIADATTDSSGSGNNLTASNMGSVVYDEFSVDVYDNSTTTDGTFTVTQGKVEGLSLTTGEFDGDDDYIELGSQSGDLKLTGGKATISAWIRIVDVSADDDFKRIIDKSTAGSATDGYALYVMTDGTVSLDVGGSTQHRSPTGAITDAKWHHVVGIINTGSGATIYVDGVEQTGGTNSGGTTAVPNETTNARIGSWNHSTAREFKGKIRDLKVFDYAFSAEQVASLYSGTYPQTALHYWKLNEGSGTTATDSGTSSTLVNGTLTNGTTYTNGTLDLDGNLTVAANGSLSLPRGNLDLASNLDVNCTTVATQFIHNNGKVVLSSTSSENELYTGGATFYNVDKTGSVRARLFENMTVENVLDMTSSTSYFDLDADGSATSFTLTMGTATSSGTIESHDAGRFRIRSNNSRLITVQGVSTLYPCNVTGNDWDWDATVGSQGIQLANMNFQVGVVTNDGGVKIILTGDCEFDAVTVSDGDTLDLNGQRAVFGGDFDLTTGALSMNDSMAIFTGNIDFNGRIITSNTGSTIIHDPPHTSQRLVTSLYFGGTFFAKGVETEATGYHWRSDTSGQYPAKIFVGGEFDCNDLAVKTSTSLQVATGGDLRGRSNTLTCEGDFTTSGGLLGASCLTLDGTDEYASTTSAVAVGINSAWTIEGWMKRDDGVSGNEVFVELKTASNNNNRVWFNIDTDDVQMLIYSNGGSLGLAATANQGLNDGKWHHVACTYDSTTAKIYIDGKLTTSEVISKTVDNTDDRIINIGANVGTYANGFTGSIDEVRIWSDVRTEAEIRANMFTEVSDSAAGLVQYWKFNQGTGSTASASTGNSLGLYDGSSSATDLWAGAGTFTAGTSTVVMAKSGTQTIAYTHQDNDFDSLTINAGSTTQLFSVGQSGNNALQDINEDLVVNGILKSHPDTASARLRIRDPNATFTVGSSVKTTALADLANLVIDGNGTFNVPELTTKTINITSSGTQVSASGPLTLTEELEVNSGTTFNANGNTITCSFLDVDGGTMDLRNSTYLGSTAGALNRFDFFHGGTLLTGNTTVTGTASPLTMFYLPAQYNYEIVGDVSNVRMRDSGDLTVIGSVTNFTLDDSTNNIRQWHHTLDTQQLLDADEAGDDDLRLTKPALDNALELMTK